MSMELLPLCAGESCPDCKAQPTLQTFLYILFHSGAYALIFVPCMLHLVHCPCKGAGSELLSVSL